MIEESLAHKISEASARYLEAVRALRSFLSDVTNSFATMASEHNELARKFQGGRTSVETQEPPPTSGSIRVKFKSEEVKLVRKALDQKAKLIQTYPDLLPRLGWIYAVALFDGFISDAFMAVLVCRPETMRSSKRQLSYESILSLQNRSELVSFMASREINEMSYKSIEDQAHYYRDRFGIDVGQSGVPIARLAEIRALRNLLVHNDGIVNRIYLEGLASPRYELGERVKLTSGEVESAVKDLGTVADYVKRTIISKFKEQPL